MVRFLEQQQAFGSPGIEPRWTHADKIGVGTAYSTSSRLWYTLWSGIVTEVYYPTVDTPQIRDLQYLITDSTSYLDARTCGQALCLAEWLSPWVSRGVYTPRPVGDAGSHRFLHEEKRDLKSEVERVGENGLEYRIINSDPDGHYQIIKQIIGDPHSILFV